MPPHHFEAAHGKTSLGQVAGIELEQTTYDQNGRLYCYDRQIWRGELAEFSSLTVVRDVKNDIRLLSFE